MDNITCSGSEEQIVDCLYDTEDDCTYSEAAGVICNVNGPTHTSQSGMYRMIQEVHVLEIVLFSRDHSDSQVLLDP